MTKTITVEGDITAVDTATGLTTAGSTTAPSRQIPSGVSMIKKLIVAVAADAAAAGSCAFFLRLGGPAVKNGEQVINIAAQGIVAVQVGSDQAPGVCKPVIIDDVDIEVSQGDTITVQGEMDGSDLGTAGMVVTLEFE